jgi:hypothetical protein
LALFEPLRAKAGNWGILESVGLGSDFHVARRSGFCGVESSEFTARIAAFR